MSASNQINLSATWRRLIRHCARLNFGHLEDLVFEGGEPKEGFRTIKTFLPGKDNGPSRAYFEGDVPAKPQWLDVIAFVRSRPAARVLKLEVAHGLPLKLQVVEEVEAGDA